MRNSPIENLREFIEDFFKQDDVRIILFGSRARCDNHIASDVDIGVIPKGEFDKTKLVLLREKLENINIPYKVELINLNEVSPDFKNRVIKEGLVWKN